MAKFIAFEGCEGVGKSTQAKKLLQYLTESGQEAVFTREPGGTPLAEKIREMILREEMSAECEAALFAAARCDHIDNLILPALRKGKIVVCDRFLDSSIVYQAYARGLGEEKIRDLNFYALENCMPDAVVFLDMDPRASWRKKSGKIIENDRLEAETEEFHLKVYEGYKSLALRNDRYIRIVPDIDKEVTFGKIKDALKERGLIK